MVKWAFWLSNTIKRWQSAWWVLVWLLVRIVLEHEGVVQKNCIESLQCHRQKLEQQWNFSFFARHTAYFMTKGRNKALCCYDRKHKTKSSTITDVIRVTMLIDWLIEQRFNVPLDTLYVISGTIFTGQMTQPTASKHWRKPVGHWDRLQSHQK